MAIIPAEVPGPNPGNPGHFAHHDWLTASVKALDLALPSSAWTAWTPALQGATTNPVLGSTGVAVGRYARVGKLVSCWAYCLFGGTGVAAGAGTLRCTLPTTIKSHPSAPDTILGQILMRDASAGSAFMGAFRMSVTDGLQFLSPVYLSAYPTGTLVAVSLSSSQPYILATGDSVGWSLTYETADP